MNKKSQKFENFLFKRPIKTNPIEGFDCPSINKSPLGVRFCLECTNIDIPKNIENEQKSKKEEK